MPRSVILLIFSNSSVNVPFLDIKVLFEELIDIGSYWNVIVNMVDKKTIIIFSSVHHKYIKTSENFPSNCLNLKIFISLYKGCDFEISINIELTVIEICYS